MQDPHSRLHPSGHLRQTGVMGDGAVALKRSSRLTPAFFG